MIENYFEDLSTLHVGTLPRTNYFIPFSINDKLTQETTRESSSRFMSLNGEWDFHYFDSVGDIDQAYWVDDTALSYDKLPVPACWQLHGYGQIMYSNTEYPIPFDPPYVPFENPAGLYRRRLNIEQVRDSDWHLVFEGVDSAFYVWVNGHFVGYSQISHAYHSFDISPHLQVGENTLHVLVLQWSDGTYLEDQDKFRYSGIFRDVYLLERARQRIEGFKINQAFSQDFKKAQVGVSWQATCQDLEVSYQLIDPNEQVVATGQTRELKLEIQLDQPLLWNAETPYLYQLRLQTGEEMICQSIGLRQVEMRDNQFWVNGQAVKLIGVNHHDTHPNTGATVSLADQEADLLQIKANNFNAVRTAHYPKTGPFYELTDKIGLYIMSEADLEGHGVVDLYGMGGNANYNALAKDPAFEAAFVDRMDASMTPFINYCSIVMWSAGNETGYGENLEAMLKYARQLDQSRPLHYEAYWYHDRTIDYDTSLFDSWSRMYASPTEVKERYLDIPNIEKAFLLCEYAHAMGNSSGDLSEYYELFVQYPAFIGLFVWEWADHAVNIQRQDPQAPAHYRYGGDFGEFPHAGNFCMDGLVYPDRQPHVLLEEHKQVFRPIVATAFDQETGQVTLENRFDFINAMDKITASVTSYDSQGRVGTTHQMPSLDIEPHTKKIFDLSSLQGNLSDLSGLRIQYTDNEGQPRGFDWLSLQPVTANAFKQAARNATSLQVEETGRHFRLQWGHQRLWISKASAGIDLWDQEGKSLLKAPASWTIWRAPTDNDRNIKAEWYKANYDRSMVKIHNYQLKQDQEAIEIEMDGVMNAPARQNIVTLQIKWRLDQTGTLTVSGRVSPNPIMPYLPRFGLTLPLQKSFDQVTYYGLGPHENYLDKSHASYPARFQMSPSELYEPYVTPQENGNRSQVSWLSLTDRHLRFDVYGQDTINFSALHYSIEQLTRVSHRDLLHEEDATFLQIDPAQSGIGTNACGPELFDYYRLQQDFDFVWQMQLTTV